MTDKRRELAEAWANQYGLGVSRTCENAFLAGYDASDSRVKGLVDALNDIAAWDFLPNASQWHSMKKARKAIADWEAGNG